MSVSRHIRKSKHSSGSGESRNLKSFKIEHCKRLMRKGFSEHEARDICQLTGSIPFRIFKPRHRSGNVSGIIAKTFEANKRERFLTGDPSIGRGGRYG